MIRLGTIAALFAILFVGKATGQSVILKGDKTDVLGQMEYLKDPTDALDLEAVMDKNWQELPTSSKSPNFGFDRTVYWFKFSITNSVDETDWLMEVPYAPLDQVTLYLKSDSAALITKEDGDIFPISNRELAHRHPIFKIRIAQNETKTIYLRVKTISSVQVPVIFWTNEGFHVASYRVQLINGLFIGAMLIMTLYQLFLYLSIRDKTTLYYVLTLVSMVNVISFFQGYNFLYLHPSFPRLNDDFAAMSGPLFILFSALLTRSFLNIQHFSKLLDRVLLTNAAVSLAVGIILVIFHRSISYKYHHLFTLFHCLVVLVSAAYCLLKRYRPALYYLIAWATLLLAAAVFTIGNLALVSGFLGTNYLGLMVGCVLQILLISFALGERWNILVRENQRAKELELRRGQEENIRLEQVVRERTDELVQQKMKLEELNEIKDKLFSIVSHDIKEPLTSLKLSLALVRMEKLNQQEFQLISNELEQHLDNTTDFIQNLLQWAKFQLRGEELKPVLFSVNNLIQETITLLSTNAHQKAITINAEFEPTNPEIRADIVMIQSVIRNLLTNALKFSPVGETITLRSSIEGGDKVVIRVSDKGAGIPNSSQDKLFTLASITTKGTKSEWGTGLGLVLCKEFLELNSGAIAYTTEEGHGTTFVVTLPLNSTHEKKTATEKERVDQSK